VYKFVTKERPISVLSATVVAVLTTVTFLAGAASPSSVVEAVATTTTVDTRPPRSQLEKVLSSYQAELESLIESATAEVTKAYFALYYVYASEPVSGQSERLCLTYFQVTIDSWGEAADASIRKLYDDYRILEEDINAKLRSGEIATVPGIEERSRLIKERDTKIDEVKANDAKRRKAAVADCYAKAQAYRRAYEKDPCSLAKCTSPQITLLQSEIKRISNAIKLGNFSTPTSTTSTTRDWKPTPSPKTPSKPNTKSPPKAVTTSRGKATRLSQCTRFEQHLAGKVMGLGGCTIYFEAGPPVSIWTTVMWARSGGVVDDDYYVKRSGQYLMGCDIVLYASGGWKETCSNL
jgi:hypothetical protein